MFHLATCSHHGCASPSLYLEGEDFGGLCARHMDEAGQKKAVDAILAYVAEHEKVVGLSAAGLTFRDWDITGKRFYGCSFQGCTFERIRGREHWVRLCSFDFASFVDCTFIQGVVRFTSFAGCRLERTKFTDSELVHDNFSGIVTHDSAFDDTNLYNSRFVAAKLNDTGVRNCLVTNVDFTGIECRNVSFKTSNTREAIFSKGMMPE
jgi:uncharacterized protein YjbI with pentapeptide repeats